MSVFVKPGLYLDYTVQMHSKGISNTIQLIIHLHSTENSKTIHELLLDGIIWNVFELLNFQKIISNSNAFQKHIQKQSVKCFWIV